MALLELTDEQVQKMSLEEKDRWWLQNVWKGDMPQLTFRAMITGALLGGILSLTNLYIGMKTGWGAGVAITSVIISYVAFKVMARIGIGKEMTILENNAMQSISTAAGYMTSPMIASLAAYMAMTQTLIPMYQMITWMIATSILGVLYAFPLKKRFINDEQYPFPEGKACGVVLDGLHNPDESAGHSKGHLLFGFAVLSSIWTILRSEKIMGLLKVPFHLPEYFDDLLYKFISIPTIMGVSVKTLLLRWETDIVMLGTGGLIGIRASFSLFLGALFNYAIMAPIMINKGAIVANAAGVITYRQITTWALWGGVAMMTTASLYSFFSKPKIIVDAFIGIFKRGGKSNVLGHIELPMKVFVIGVPLMSFIAVALSHYYFGLSWIMGFVAIPLTFIFALIAVHSTALTSITPTGPLGKLSQLTYAVLSPGNITSNIIPAGINSETALNASNLLMDIKPGYMLGAKPRQQAVGHVIGIFAGALFAVPVFYWMLNGDLNLLMSEKMPMPAAQTWRAVAEVLTKGLSFLHPTAQYAMLIGGVLGIVVEVLKNVTKGRFWLGAVAFGLGIIIPFYTSFSMFLGAFIFWFAGKIFKKKDGWVQRVFIPGNEAICAGVIAGGALMGIIAILIELKF